MLYGTTDNPNGSPTQRSAKPSFSSGTRRRRRRTAVTSSPAARSRRSSLSRRSSRARTHVKFADIQCVLEGDETIYVRAPDGLHVQEEYLADRDIAYYSQPADGAREEEYVMLPGRFIRDGKLLVHGLPVDDARSGGDPFNPVPSADVAEVLAGQTEARITNLSLARVRAGEGALAESIAALTGTGARILAAVAEIVQSGQRVHVVAKPSEAAGIPGQIDVFPLGGENDAELAALPLGKVDPRCGDAAYRSVKLAIGLAMAKDLDGILAELADFNVPAADLDVLVEDAYSVRRLLDNNPREVTKPDIRAIYSALL